MIPLYLPPSQPYFFCPPSETITLQQDQASLVSRIGAKIAAYNSGILVNRHFDRPDLAFATLVV